MTEQHLRERFATLAATQDDSDWGDVRRRARMPRRRTALALAVLAALVAFAAPALGLEEQLGRLFEQGNVPPPVERTITSMVGEEPIGLDARATAAMGAGPEMIQCEPGREATLACHAIPSETLLAAIRRGETVYGRTVTSIGGGAKTGQTDARPMFQSTDLVCAEPPSEPLVCVPVTVMQPTIREGSDVFVHYTRQDVRFDSRGNLVFHVGEATVSFRVAPR